MKFQLERKYSCRIIIHNGRSPAVSIHGLYRNETTLCRSEIEGCLTVTERVFLTGYQFLYLKARCSKKLDEMRETCQKFSLPRIQKDQNLNEEVFVLVGGKSDNVKNTATELRQLVPKSKFKVETFSLTCLDFISHLWKQKWSETVDDLQEKYDVVVAFSPSYIPPHLRQPFDRTTVETKKSVFNFQVYGPDGEGVSEAKKVFTERENGQAKKETIPLQKADVFRVKDALKSDKLTLTRNVRWQYEPNKLVLFAPATATSDIEAARTDVLNFLENMTVSVKHVPCPDEVVAMVLLAQRGILFKEVMPVAREQRVTVTLQSKPPSVKVNGTQCGKEIVIPIIKKVLRSIEDSIDTATVECPPLTDPFLTTEDGVQFLSKLRQRHSVVVNCAASLGATVGEYGNVKLQEGMYQPPKCMTGIKVSIIKGDILKEAVDVIVNAANDELKHIGGLAKVIADAGGEQIQRESKAYLAKHSPTGKLTAGDAVLLGPGKLAFKKIIHAVGPRWNPASTDDQSDQLTLAFFNSLCIANEAGLSSIALPAIGTGVFAVPESVCASAAVHALNNFCTSSPSRTLTDVRFVLFTEKATSVFQSYFPLSQASPVASPSSPISTADSAKPLALSPISTVDSATPLALSPISTVDSAMPLAMSSISTVDSAKPLAFSTAGVASSRKTSNLTWSWQDDTRSFIPYDEATCRMLTQSYRDNSSGQCTLSVPGRPFQYNVDFGKMMQVNSSTGYPRKIKFQQPITSEDEESEEEDIDKDEDEDEEQDEVQWLYRDDSGNFSSYQPDHSRQIEAWYQLGSSGRLLINRFRYTFDFEKMVQINSRTLRERDIQRKCNPTLITDTPNVKVTLRGPATNLARASRDLLHALQNSIKTEKLTLRCSSKALRGFLMKIARTHKVEVKFESSTGKTSACLRGVSSLVQKALVEMQKVVIEHMPTESNDKVQFPAEWQPQEKTTELFPLVRGSAEWRRVEQKFAATMVGVQITSIERVQNTWLWEKYVQHKKMIHKKNAGSVNEMELFHGTSGNNPLLIYGSEEGFDMRYSAQGMWGLANYFAVNASYSNTYAHTTVSGQRQLFLAKVLTGDSYECGSNHALKMPPEKSSSGHVQLSQVRYDTVTGHTSGSQVFMTYDNQKAYPAYLITYGAAGLRGFF